MSVLAVSQLVVFYSVCAVIAVSLCEFKRVILGCLILVADHVSLTWFLWCCITCWCHVFV